MPSARALQCNCLESWSGVGSVGDQDRLCTRRTRVQSSADQTTMAMHCLTPHRPACLHGQWRAVCSRNSQTGDVKVGSMYAAHAVGCMRGVQGQGMQQTRMCCPRTCCESTSPLPSSAGGPGCSTTTTTRSPRWASPCMHHEEAACWLYEAPNSPQRYALTPD